MRVLDLPLETAEQNLALDDELLAESDARGSEVLRFWEARATCVVLGRSGREELDLDGDACARDGVPIVRRTSGGGAIVQGPGCLCFTLALSLQRRPELRDVAASYRAILEPIGRALGAAFEPASDLALDGRKVSGSAQRRRHGALLHHGTVLYAFDLARVERYLREPRRQPQYRRGRAHRDFLANLALRPAEIKERIATACLSLG